MCRNSKTLFLLAMVIFAVSLLSALVPLSCFDQDGNLDSLVTEGFLLTPMLYTVTGLFCLWIKLPAACLPAPKSFSALIVLPPIPTK
jgi:glucose-6-phosphate-specific signal transduction histidine kinase